MPHSDRDIQTLDVVLNMLDFSTKWTSDDIQSKLQKCYMELKTFRKTIQDNKDCGYDIDVEPSPPSDILGVTKRGIG
jgi:hypothetical protein